jgi:hypothetical protein
MRHNRHRLSRLVSARVFWTRAVAAWRDLLPDWRPSLEELQALDARPLEHQRAVRILAYGWDNNDPRWDILLALLEWERRAERERRNAADELTRLGQEMDNVVSMDQEYERLRHDCEVTVETEFPEESKRVGGLTLVPKPGVPRAFTVRTLASIRKEQDDA